MSCAILDDDTLWCWGGRYGETPTLVREDVGDVSVGTGHACLVTLTGAAMCWGLNYYGSLGDGTTDNHRTPVPVVGLETGVAQVEAGNGISCAHLADDTVRCWGMTGLGEGGSPQYLTPTRINGVGAVDHLDVGLSDVCVVTGLGETRCWGVYPEAPMIAVTSLGLEGGSRVVRQPDLLVASPATNHLVGEGVYNSSGMDQTREVRTQVSRSATFLVQVQNDGDEADVFFVGAHAPRQSKVTTRYSIDGQKVTQRIRYGTLHRTLAPGDSFDVMVTVLLDGEVWPHERLYTRLFAWSTHDQSSSDSVLAIVDVARRQ